MRSTLLLVMGMAAAPVLGAGEVNLEWRTSSPNIRVGDSVDVDLFGISTTGEDVPLLGLTAIMTWDPAVLELFDVVDISEFPFSKFFSDANLDGLNADCGPDTFCIPFTSLPFNDGDAVFDAATLGGLSMAPLATPEGLLVERFQFVALAATPSTLLVIPETMGEVTATRVVKDLGDAGNEIVTGSLGSLTLSVAACGTMGDFDGDCRVDLSDYMEFEACASGPDVTGVCPIADFDADGFVDLRDAAGFQQWFTGP